MRGYLSLAGEDDAKEIPVEEPVGLYRDQERNQQVFAEVGNSRIPLGVSDPTVSRKKEAAPVVVIPRDEFVEVRNNGNHNPVTVDEQATDTVDREVAEGAVATVRRDATIEIGYQTELKLVVERSRKKEINVEGEKVVMGDEVDRSTNVTDSVVNRSDIGDGSSGPPGVAGGGTTVEDSVVNRTNVGGDDPPGRGQTRDDDGGDDTETRNYCEVHDRTYPEEECPQCATETGGDGGAGRDPGGELPDDGDGARETKFCIYCGEEIPAAAAHCPSCGESQPDR